MAKAHVNPEELRRFAKDLNKFSAELKGLMSGLHARLRGLEASWQDQEQKKFTDEFEMAMKSLSRFFESSDQHSAFLVKKARHIENYLQQR